jgi:hypothetical protein
MTRLISCIIMIICAAATLNAETRNVVFQWNDTYNIGGDPTNPNEEYLTIDQDTMRIVIVAGVQGKTFEFEARTQTRETENDPWVDADPGIINSIYAAENAGAVALTIVGHNGHAQGAEDVQEINLGASGVIGVIGEVVLSGDLAADGPVLASSLAGPMEVEGEILNNIQIAKLAGNISCANMRNLSMTGTESEPHPPCIYIDGMYQHRISMNAEYRSATICTLYLGGAWERTESWICTSFTICGSTETAWGISSSGKTWAT